MINDSAFLFLSSQHSAPTLAGMWLRAASAGALSAVLSMQVHGGNAHMMLVTAAAASLTALVWQWYARYRMLVGLLQQSLSLWQHGRRLSGVPIPSHGLGDLIGQLRCVIDQSLETHRMHMHLRMQLSASQHRIGDYQLLTEMHGDMKPLFSRIATYSHMLEETLAKHAACSDLRSSFDELSEQSFNLQLLLGAFEHAHQPHHRQPGQVNPAQILSRILVPLAECLDRRVMKLSSTAWDERAYAHVSARSLELMLWLVLLGTVRYAEDESTLLLSCEPAADGAHTLITCLVSELAPAAMSAHERADFMDAKTKYQSAHMFAHTLAASTNIVMAQRLANHAGGTLSIHARSQTSCLVELSLPRHA